MLDLIRDAEGGGDATVAPFDDSVEGIAVVIEIARAVENGRG